MFLLGVSIVIFMSVMLIFACGMMLLNTYHSLSSERIKERHLSKNSCDFDAEKEFMLLNTICHSVTTKFIEIEYCDGVSIGSKRFIASAKIPTSDMANTDSNNITNDVISMLAPLYIARLQTLYVGNIETHIKMLIMDEFKIYAELVYAERSESAAYENMSKEMGVESKLRDSIMGFIDSNKLSTKEVQRIMEEYGDINDSGINEISASLSVSMSRDATVVGNLRNLQRSLGVDDSVLNSIITGLPIDKSDGLDFESLGF